MRIPILCALAVLFLSACSLTKKPEEAPVQVGTGLRQWTFMVKASAHFAQGESQVPKQIYVFPALRLNGMGQPIDALSHRVDADGALRWISPAPGGAEIKTVIENKLRRKGFRILTFQQMTEVSQGHSVFVLNPYFTQASPLSVPEGFEVGDAGWTTFVRITGATFPLDLDPAKKKELMNQEAVSLFNESKQGRGVVKTSLEYLLDNIGKNKEWSESLSLL